MKCRVCGNTERKPLYEVREMMFGFRDTFQYAECAECGCLQIVEFPPDMTKYYPANYYAYASVDLKPAGIIDRTKRAARLFCAYGIGRKGIIGSSILLLIPHIMLVHIAKANVTWGTRILDVGCGNGQLLYAMKDAGFKNLLGIDPFINRDLQYQNGLRIAKSRLEEVGGLWDLIMFNHSYEHIPDPLITLKSCFDLLSDGGCCLLRIPTVSSYAWKNYRTNWVQLDAPRHFFLHSRQSIHLLAQKSGLTLAHVVYDSTAFQFWGSEQYLREIPLHSEQSYYKNSSKSIFTKAEIRQFEKRASELNSRNEGDQAVFYLMKPRSPLAVDKPADKMMNFD